LKETLVTNLIRRIVTDVQGQDLAEYGIAMAVIVAGIGLIALTIAGNVSSIWVQAEANIAPAL
jgi:hypothetical protein